MDRKMMNAWLAEQAKKAQVTEAQMQRKRLGIKEGRVLYTNPQGLSQFETPLEPDQPDARPVTNQPKDTRFNALTVPMPEKTRQIRAGERDIDNDPLTPEEREFYDFERDSGATERGRKMNKPVGDSAFYPNATSGSSNFGRKTPKPMPQPTTSPVRRKLSEAAVRNKILGVVQQAEARNKAGESATAASTPITEQLNAEEEKYAKEHKSMLAGMVKQYGKEKGTRVFYATVRNKVRGK